MKAKYLILAATFISVPFTKSFAGDGGGDMFKANCGACHTVGKGKLVGPDLQGVETRHNENWMLKWIKSSQTLVQAGDKDAVKLFADNSSIPMPDQALTDDQIKTILGFIKAGGQEDVIVSVAAAPTIVPDNATTANPKTIGEEKNSASFFAMFSFTEYVLISLLGFLLLIIYILGMTIKTLTETTKEETRI